MQDVVLIGDVVWLLAGLPTSVPATTVNRLCGSSLDAAIIGSRAVESGNADIVLTPLGIEHLGWRGD